MSDTIRYVYESNNAHLEDVGAKTIEAQTLREEVAKVFTALSGVYEGQAATTLQERQIQISGAMDAVLAEIKQTQNNGNQSQEDARALDAKLAGGF